MLVDEQYGMLGVSRWQDDSQGLDPFVAIERDFKRAIQNDSDRQLIEDVLLLGSIRRPIDPLIEDPSEETRIQAMRGLQELLRPGLEGYGWVPPTPLTGGEVTEQEVIARWRAWWQAEGGVEVWKMKSLATGPPGLAFTNLDEWHLEI